MYKPFLLLLLIGCAQKGTSQAREEIIPLHTGTQFRFKGLAIDDNAEYVYLGCWDKKEIVKVSLANGKTELLKTKYSGKLNAMGCVIKNKKLYTVMNEVDDTPGATPISVLVIFELDDGRLLAAYESRGVNGRNHFNHVAVDDYGVAYISNTLKSAIYIVNTNDPGDHIREFIVHPDLSWVHGIDLAPDGKRLFCTSYEGGITILDVPTKTFLPYRDKSLAGDDGLKYHDGALYGVGQNMIRRYTLDKSLSAIIKTDTLAAGHAFFNDPRCLQIKDGWLWCLANIEFEPVSFPRSKAAARTTPLDDTYLIKFVLSR